MDKITQNLVSVIVPTHNRPEFLQQALLSIVKQNYSLIEIIVIANGCGQKTKEIVNKIQSRTQIPIIFLDFANALGGAKARNIGLDKAQGEYIAFLDDDDSWHKDKLSIQISLLQQKKVAIVGSNYFYVNANNQHRQAGGLKSPYLRLEHLYYENALGGFSFCLTKKSYLGNSCINENLDALQDWDLWFKILKNSGLPAYISTDYLVYFRLSGSRISTNYQKVSHAQQYFLQNWQTDLDKRSIFYHQMRITCLKIKLANTDKIYRYLKHLPVIIKAVFCSPDRYNLKRYLHYLLLPIADIDGIRAKIAGKNKAK